MSLCDLRDGRLFLLVAFCGPAGTVQYLIIPDHDRFSRNLSEALAKITELQKKFGVKVLAVDEPVSLDINDSDVFLGCALKCKLANHEFLKSGNEQSEECGTH